MNMRISVGFLGLLLGGCLSTNAADWHAGPPDRFRADAYTCRQDASAVVSQSTAQGGAVAPLAGLLGMRSVYHECMAARGWIKR